MSSITTAFADALATVSRPGTFFIAGSQQMLAPGLEVDGVGAIGLPLTAVQAEQLIASAERAPYGRGEATVTDITVRRTWQIGADRVQLRSKYWPATLASIVTHVAEGLGVADPIDAELYKLLIYDQGSFFVPHRDTEKSPGMFATLILVLPSVSEGGELIVRHKDRAARLALRCEEPSDVAFGAFYADCVHEVLPVTAGHRLVLVYNLLRRGAGRLPGIPDYNNEVATVAERLERWAETQDGSEPDKLIFPLEHAYTPAELSFAALKGADAGVGQVVVAAAVLAGCSVHLALVSIEESGSAVQTGGYQRSRHSRYHDDDDDEEFEVVEVDQRDATASDWRRPDSVASPLTDLPVLETEFSPPLSFEELEPDEEHFHEATGNEGATYERTYRRAALILWPENRLLTVINQGGLGVTLPFLEDLGHRWARQGDSTIRTQAAELSDLMTAEWPGTEWYPNRDQERTAIGRFLSALVRLHDTPRLEAFLMALPSRPGFDIGDCADIGAALCALPPDRAAELLRDIVAASAVDAVAACGALLAQVAGSAPGVCLPAAGDLVKRLPRDRMPGDPPISWRRGPGVRPGFIVDLLTALVATDPVLAGAAVDHVLRWPATYDFDTVLVPASSILLVAANTVRDAAAVVRLRSACIEHLDHRIALDLQPPADWRRDDSVGCDCVDCQAMSRFLRDATQKQWIFAAAQPRRSHLEATIRNRRCDVDHLTEKVGSPHRLVCTKNQASYQRRCEQRADDLQARARLIASR
jgi:predicted 2-oxoglutarate/Fe(II)-dependent dioxygenase YbiX